MIRVQRLSTSSFKLVSPQGKVIMLSPWLIGDPLWPKKEREPKRLAEVEVVLVSHAHFDHSSGVEEIAKANTKVKLVCQDELASHFMAKGLKNVYPMNKGGTMDIDGIKYSMVEASHTSSFHESRKEYVGTAVGFIIEFEDGFKIYASGDTGLTSDMRFVVGEYFKPDLAILPVIGTFVMEPEQAVVAASWIGAKYVIPTHDFPEEINKAADPKGYKEITKAFPIVLETRAKTRRFAELMKRENPDIEVVILDFGQEKEIG